MCVAGTPIPAACRLAAAFFEARGPLATAAPASLATPGNKQCLSPPARPRAQRRERATRRGTLRLRFTNRPLGANDGRRGEQGTLREAAGRRSRECWPYASQPPKAHRFLRPPQKQLNV
ncbi:hypothetical protein NDU88_006269 [Pleurodeles waltl]|uniref:Uncharacterized protein n=1 Tax=Pleurodeles waltl TaxID=8319 RepID=A0AAV7WA94_PLEWA|nr:hypothetical protein NDU88_006269 [Pleurodeles waltl]